MDHIVYFLGAGFSAPLGIPVMRNFLVRSKDMFAEDPKRYKHFEKVFELIRDMNVAKSYYETDLFNIEEILSILETRDQIGGKRAKRFIKYIADVIEYYTPEGPVTNTTRYPGNWHDRVLADAPIWSQYFYFLLNLFNLRVEDRRRVKEPFTVFSDEAVARYSIITLNYDLVFERLVQCLANSFVGGNEFTLDATPLARSGQERLPIAKLHGSADTQDIIPPTWNKGINKRMVSIWASAHEILRQANQIRIIGYSLPVADAYIKYLLKSAAIDSSHLKQIDVLCRDTDDRTWSRYRDFIRFDYARFSASDVRLYLETIRKVTTFGASHDSSIHCNRLETAHEQFFDTNGFNLQEGRPKPDIQIA